MSSTTTDLTHLHTVRAAYDTVAVDYAELVPPGSRATRTAAL